MNCPKCGLPTLADQKFCRSCGAVLQIVTQPLAEQIPSLDLEPPRSRALKSERRQGGLVVWAFAIMFIGVALGVIGKMLMHSEIVTFVGVLVSIAGMFLTALPFLTAARPNQSELKPSSKAELRESQTKNHLAAGGNTAYVPSVTERTTNLLKVPLSANTQPEGEGDRKPKTQDLEETQNVNS